MIKLAIVEDHPVVADGLAALLKAERDITLVGTASDLQRARRLLANTDIDVVLCDVVLGGEDAGLELISAVAPGTRPVFLMFSAFARPDYHRRAIELGAAGYLPKMMPIDGLTQAIRAVAAGGTAFPAGVLRSARAALRRPSDRQREVIALVAEGHRNEEIASRLSVQVKTIEGQLRRLFDRYGVTNRVALVRVAEREGWIRLPDAPDPN